MADTILTAFITAASTTGVFGIIFKVWFEYQYARRLDTVRDALRRDTDKQIETHRAQLRKEYDEEIERLRAELAEKHLRFSYVYENAAKTLGEIHIKLQDVSDAADEMQMSNPQNPEDPKHQAARKKVDEQLSRFRDYFVRYRIFIPDATADLIWHYFSVISSKHRAFMLGKSSPQGSWPEVWQHVLETTEAIPKLQKKLRNNFQKFLGYPVEEITPEKSQLTTPAA